jgi:purine-binding chemotaxis protein CheW
LATLEDRMVIIVDIEKLMNSGDMGLVEHAQAG